MSAEARPNHQPSRIERHHSLETRQLLDAQTRALLPAIEALNPNHIDMLAQLKYTAPEIPSWALYVAAFDGEDTLFGLWTSFYEVQFGFYSLSELESSPQHLEITVQRDEQFEPISLREIAALHEATLAR
jgi:hypothetical protein